MKYVFLLLFMAAVFGVCALADLLIRRLVPKLPQQAAGKTVRLPRRAAVFGVLLTFFGGCALIGFFSQMRTLVKIACVVVTGMGVFLLVQYLSFGVFYDGESFACRTLGRRAKTYRYGQIRGQRSLLTRSGVNITLVMEDGEQAVLAENLDGLKPFLQFAFRRWCEETGTDPEQVVNNPDLLTYFPEPEE